MILIYKDKITLFSDYYELLFFVTYYENAELVYQFSIETKYGTCVVAGNEKENIQSAISSFLTKTSNVFSKRKYHKIVHGIKRITKKHSSKKDEIRAIDLYGI